MAEKRRIETEAQEQIELQTFYARQREREAKGDIPSTSSTHSHRHHHNRSKERRPRLHRPVEGEGLRQYPISSIDDDDQEPYKKESIQAEVHPYPCSHQTIFGHQQIRPLKTRSLTELSIRRKEKKKPGVGSDSRLQDAAYIAEHSRPQPRHFCRRPSLISLQNTDGQIIPPSEPASSALQTPSTPHQPMFVGEGPESDAGTLEFHLGANGIERRRLKVSCFLKLDFLYFLLFDYKLRQYIKIKKLTSF